MHPVFFSFGAITIYTFGVFAFFAFLLAVFLFWRFSHGEVPEEDIFDLAIATAFFGFAGARIFHIFLHWQDFWPHIDRFILFIRYPGFSLYGGIIAGGTAFLIIGFFKRLNVRHLADCAAIALLPAFALGRTGEFFSSFWENRHPVQLYLAVCFLLFFTFAVKFGSKKKNDGLLFLLTLFFYGFLNLVFSFYQEGKDIFTIRLFSALFSLLGLTIIVFWFKKEIIGAGISLIAKIKGGIMFKRFINFPVMAVKAVAVILEKQKKETEKRLAALKKEDPYEDTSRLLDNASDDTEAAEEAGHERITALKAELEKNLAKIKKALSRIGVGKYGICDKCGEKIDPARLKIFPMADTCVVCERKKE